MASARPHHGHVPLTMDARNGLAAAAFLAMALSGCERLVTYAQLNEVWHDSGATYAPLPPSTWYYRGSDDRYHYFAYSRTLSDRYRSYKVESKEIVVRGAFPLTQTRSEGKCMVVRLASFQTPATFHFPRELDFTER